MSSEPQRVARPTRLIGLLAVVTVVTVLAVGVIMSGGTRGMTAGSPGPSIGGVASPLAPRSPAPTDIAAPPVELGSIRLGGRVDAPPAAMPGPAGSLAYGVDVPDSGGRLRVSVDLSNRDDCVELRLTDPGGVARMSPGYDYPFVCPSSGRSGQAFGIEASVPDAPAGRWRIDVDGGDVRDLALRLRVVLEPPPTAAAASPTDGLRYPDLVPWLPWEFGFAAPVSDTPGTAHDRDNGPGDPSRSCHPVEEPEDTRCLRFSAGVYNVGDGPLTVVFRGDRAIQHIYRGDATPLDHTDDEREARFEEREAGAGEWHPFHEHRHLAEFVLYELFAIADDGTLTSFDDGAKHGYCTFSQQIADWTSTTQDPQYASFPDGVFCEDAMTLERGWGDLYRWQRPGQYVSYAAVAEPDGSMRAGRYVLRFTVDPEDHIAERDESNNVGYARIDVVDGGGLGHDEVIVCEQGLGDGPADPAATLVEDRFAWAKVAIDPAYAAPTCG